MVILYILLGILIALAIAILMVTILKKPADNKQEMLDIKQAVDTSAAVTKELFAGHAAQMQGLREDNSRAVESMMRANADMNAQHVSTINGVNEILAREMKEMRSSVAEQVTAMRTDNSHTMESVLHASNTFAEQSAKNTQALTETVNREMQNMRTDMQGKLDEIRHTVDEQLQTNLEKKLQESFRTVSEQLLAVQRGLGEMNQLATDVGDLRRTLSSVKTRGIWGEVQLGAILSDILTPDQYEVNFATVPKSTNRVEFAIKLPGANNDVVYLPIDSKFPGDTYSALLEAYDSANPVAVESAWKALETTLMTEAKDIHDKYISVPDTTEFGIMFLPVEGLYAEAVKRGMVEKLQQKYKINIAGPTTMAALLNSLQMGFKTLQIQRQSGEVWKILQATRTEFEKYAAVLTKTQDRLKQAQDELETLVGVRTRMLTSKLSKIEQYTPGELPPATIE